MMRFQLRCRRLSGRQRSPIQGKSLFDQELLYVSLKEIIRLDQLKTRNALGGPFFKDWGYILGHINIDRWSDGGKWTTNDIGHPMDGAIAGFVYRRNDDRIRRLEFDLRNKEYRAGIIRAFFVAAVVSTESEIGPISEATIGHVGLKAEWWLHLDHGALIGPVPEDVIGLKALKASKSWQRGGNGTGCTDFVMTPFGGVTFMMLEDVLDKYVVKTLENHIRNRFVIATVRVVTNPTRS